MTLLAAAILFTAAAAISVYQLSQERNSLLFSDQAGTRVVADIQVEYLRTLRAAEAFRGAPDQKNLDRLRTAFAAFRDRSALVETSPDTVRVRDIPTLAAASSEVEKYLPLLDADLQQVNVADAGSVVPFLQKADNLNLLIAHMMEQVFTQDSRLFQRTHLIGDFDLTNIVLGVALATGLILVLLGLVQLKRTEELAGQNLRTQALLETRIRAIEATRDGIALVAPDGTVEFANGSLVGMLGIASADVVLGQSWSEIPAIGSVPLSAGQPGQSVSREVAIDQRVPGRAVKGMGTKEVRHWDLSITSRSDGGSVVLVRDITDRRLAQRQNELLREQFLRSQKMEAVGRLAGGIAHDFNNLLAVVSGFALLLKEDLAGHAEHAGFAGQILAASEQGKELVKRILSFSRADIERQSIVDPREVVTETVKMLSSALPRRDRFFSVIPEKLPAVRGNATQITQVITNLVLNASDATEDNGGAVSLHIDTTTIDGGCAQGLLAELAQHVSENPIRVVQVDEETSKAWIGVLSPSGEYLHIHVADTGSGIPFNVMERMFDPFFTTKDQGKGTGLGLASVIGIVKSHHGAIAVETRLGTGSDVHILLPVAKTDISEPKPVRPIVSPAGLSGIRVLIVDDDIAVGTVLQKMFDRLDCDATLCGDSLIARESIIEDPSAFDLIVTDMTMPELNGIDLAMSCRQAGFAGTVILVTGRAETVSEPFLRNAGIDGLIAKPFTQDDVAREIRQALGHAAMVMQ
jgi:signal transduction histidine kinase/ActR/RegA family two-component response regulator